MRGLTVLPQIAGGALPPGLGSALVPFSRVRVVLRVPRGAVTVDRLVAFPDTVTALRLSLDVPLATPGATDETQELLLAYINAAGDTVFRGGPITVPVRAAGSGPPPEPIGVPLRYTGVGATATAVSIAPRTDSVTSGSPFTFTASALDAQSQIVSGVPIGWYLLDTTLATLTSNRAGAGTTRAGRGTARLVAVLPTGAADTVPLVVRPRAQTLALVSGGGQVGTQGAALPQPIVVRVTATDNLPMAGVTVAFTAGGVNGSVAPVNATTDANGLAQATWTLGTGATAQQLTVTAPGLTGSPLVVPATAPAVATQLAVTAVPATAVSGVALAPAVTVEARDAGGARVTTFTGTVTLALTGGTPGATLGGTISVAAVAGVATFSTLTVDFAGTGYQLTASAPALVAGTSAAFAVTPGAATRLAFSVPPTTVAVGAPITPAVQVRALDAVGNLVTAFTGGVTVALAANPGAATLGGTLTRAAVAGVATFGDLTVSAAGSGYTLAAASAGLASATSGPFNATAVGAQLNRWTNAAGGTWSTGTNWSLGRAPITGDSVVIDAAGTYAVTMDVNFSGTHLTVGGGSGTQTLAVGARTLSLSQSHRVLATGAVSLAGGGSVGGAAPVENAGLVTLGGGSVGTLLSNTGNVVATGSAAIASLVNDAAAVLEVRPPGTSIVLTVNTSFTNDGTILLTTSVPSGSASLALPAGQTLTNAGRIRTLAGAGGGFRTLAAQVINRDTIDARQLLLTINTPSGGTWLNEPGGVIRADSAGGGAGMTVNQTGATFTNSGTILLGGNTMSVNNGTLNLTTGILSGDAGTLVTNGVTLNLDLANARTRYNFGTSTASILGTALTIPTTDSLRVVGGTLNTGPGLTVNGRLVALGSATLSALGMPTSGIVEVRPPGTSIVLTVSTSFTNNGTILLTTSVPSGAATLALPAGQTLTNAGRIRTLAGAGGGFRTLAAQVINQDTIDARQLLLTINTPSGGTWLNDVGGVIRADSVGGGTGVTVNQTGATFTNSGTILLGGNTMSVNAGTLNLTTGTLSGDAGTLVTNGVTLNLNLANARTRYNFGTSTASTLGTALTIPTTDSLRVVGGTLNTGPGLTVNGRLVALGTATLETVVVPASGIVEVRPPGTSIVLTVSTGFTNNGTILLTTTVPSGSAALALPAGQTLTNAGRIRTLAGAGGGFRTLAAQVINRDTIDARQLLLTLNTPSGGTWLNDVGGVVRADSAGGGAGITVNQTGATFTNSGTILLGGNTMSVNNGTLNLTAGALTGDAGTLVTNGVTLNLNLANARTRYNFGTSTASTLGTALTIPTTDSLRIVGGTLNTGPGLTVNGRLVALGTATLETVVVPASGIVEVRPPGTSIVLTVSTGFTNNGTILLTTTVPSGSATLALPAGQTLTNAGRIRTLAGAGGGFRTLAAQVINQDTIDARQLLLTINTPSGGTWLNDVGGVVRADSAGGGAGITVNQTGGTFTNSGSIFLGGNTMSVNNGTLNLAAGTLNGNTGTLVTNGVTLNLNLANARTRYNFGTSTASTLGTALTIPAADSLRVVGGTLNTGPGLTVGGRLVALGSATLSALAVPTGGIVEVRPPGTSIVLTVNTSFTNNGTIQLTTSVPSGSAALTLPVGQTLTNAGAIQTLAGAGGGFRSITTPLLSNSAGATITVGAGLTLTGALEQGGTLNVNTGTMTVSGLTRLLSGSFTSSPNGVLTFTGGCQNLGGSLGPNVFCP